MKRCKSKTLFTIQSHRWMDAPMDSEVLLKLGKKDSSPFGCESIEAQTGKYSGNPCGSGKLCGPYKVHKPDDNINGEERYQTSIPSELNLKSATPFPDI